MESSESFCEKYFPDSSIGDFYPVDDYIDPSSRVGDQELISKLESITRWRKAMMYKLNARFNLDWPSSFFLFMQADKEEEAAAAAAAGKKSWKTPHGEWCQKYMSAIPNTSQGNSPNSPKFVGTKTTLEFKPTDAKKGILGMARYNMLTTRENIDGLYLEEDLALCYVYLLEGKNKAGPKRKRNRTSEQFEGFAPPELNRSEQVMSELDFKNMHPIDTGDYPIDELIPSKRPGSDQWDNFTKIYTKNPKLMYAACNHCNTMLKLTSQRGPASSCGTSSLENHSKASKCMKKQLPSNSSTIIEHAVVEI